MQLEAWGQVFWAVLTFTSSRKASLQTRTSEAVEDAQYLSRVTAGAGHYQEGAEGQMGEGLGTWGRQQRGV